MNLYPGVQYFPRDFEVKDMPSFVGATIFVQANDKYMDELPEEERLRLPKQIMLDVKGFGEEKTLGALLVGVDLASSEELIIYMNEIKYFSILQLAPKSIDE